MRADCSLIHVHVSATPSDIITATNITKLEREREKERAEVVENSEKQTEEMEERMTEPERGTQRAAKRHEELPDAILQ